MQKERMTYIKLVFANVIIVIFVIGSILLNVVLLSKIGSNIMFMSALIFLWIGLGLVVLYCILLLVFYMTKGMERDLY